MHLMVTGKVAELEPVPKAVIKALKVNGVKKGQSYDSMYPPMLKMKASGLERVTAKYMSGRTTKPWTTRPIITVRKYMPSLVSSLLKSFVSRIWPAIRKQTPTGVR